MYGPPDGIGPAQGAYILTEKTDKQAFVASIMQAAEKGAVDLARPGEEWAITDKAGPAGWAGLDSVTQRVARLTGGPGLTFTASPSDVDAGQKLKSELSGFESATRSWAKEAGFMQSAGLGCLGGLFVIGGGILALAIAGFNLVRHVHHRVDPRRCLPRARRRCSPPARAPSGPPRGATSGPAWVASVG